MQKVLSVQEEQLAWQRIHLPSCKKYPVPQLWQSPLELTELQPNSLIHCPPNRYVFDKDGQVEQTNAVDTIWKQHSEHPTLTALVEIGHCKQFLNVES